jgi:hypothetical protein
MRRTPTADALIPALYLEGISTGDFIEAVAASWVGQTASISTSGEERTSVLVLLEATAQEDCQKKH